jgi:CubicO group peptidase (beta-lactamase class C family)
VDLLKNFLIAGLISVAVWSCQSSQSEDHSVNRVAVKSAKSPFPPLTEAEKDKYGKEVEAIVEQSLLRGSFNGAVLVAKNGTIVYERYVGFQEPRTKKDSIRPETPFQIASSGKTLTAAAVLKLAQEGALNLEDSVKKFFPGFPYAGITVKMLLNHRSGLPNYLYYMEKMGWDRKKPATNTDVLNTLISWHPPKAYTAGMRFNYCNTNYVLLALIVEKVSGMAFPDYMKQHFFDPLGMSNSFVHHVNNREPVLMSFQPNNALWTLDFSDGPYGDKNIFVTPRDLLKWDQALYQNSILDKEMLDSAYQPYSNERPGIHNYGLGWRMLLLPNNKKVVYHNGHWHGFNSAFARLTDENATVIIITNKYNPGVYNVARKLYNVFGAYDGRADDNDDNSGEANEDNSSQQPAPVLKKKTTSKKTVAKKPVAKKTAARKKTATKSRTKKRS